MIRSDFRGRRRAERRVRLGLWLLALAAAVPGLWALIAPRSFFDGFPGFGFSWVALEPPFNQHLTIDVGAFYTAFAVLFAFAAHRMEKRLTIPVLVAWLVFSLPHLFFHLSNLEGYEGADAWGQTGALIIVIVVPLAIMPQASRSTRG